MEAIISISTLNGVWDIENFNTDFLTYYHDLAYVHLTLNLETISFVKPEAIMALLCAARLWWQHKNQQVHFKLNSEVQKYLERMNVFTVCKDFIYTDRSLDELYSRSNFSYTLMELMPVSADPKQNADDVYTIYSTAVKLLSGWILFPDRVKRICSLLSEIVENVPHGQRPGLALMQRYKIKDGSRIHIVVADIGIGIEGSLSQRYEFGSSAEYLWRSLQRDISSRAERGGAGLANVEQIVRQGNGTLTIRSGPALLVIDREVRVWNDLSNVLGTQIYITINGKYDDWKYLLPEEKIPSIITSTETVE